MGNLNDKTHRSSAATITITIENQIPAFNSENPIIGVITIDAQDEVPAYCIQATLQQKEHAYFS